MDRIKIGSMIAKGGFINEIKICDKFNSWQIDVDAQKWLLLMGYEVDKIKEIKADHIPVRISKEKVLNLGISPAKYEETIKYKKADIQVRLEIIIDDILPIDKVTMQRKGGTPDPTSLQFKINPLELFAS